MDTYESREFESDHKNKAFHVVLLFLLERGANSYILLSSVLCLPKTVKQTTFCSLSTQTVVETFTTKTKN